MVDWKPKNPNATLQILVSDTKKVEDRAFAECFKLLAVRLPNCTAIGNSAFFFCH